jgi:hypothetical protein
MRKILANILFKRVRLMDETYTIGEIILVSVFTILFILLCGFMEYIGNICE